MFVEEGSEAVRVWCAGELDVAAARSLRRTIEVLRPYGRPVVVDVGGISGADVVGAASLAQHVRQLREGGLPVMVVAADYDLREMMELIGCADTLGSDSVI